MNTYQLAQVALIHGGGRLRLSGKDFVDDGVNAYGAAGLNGQVEVAEYTETKAIVLSAIGARCGKCFYVEGDWTSLANTQVIIPDANKVLPRFLWYQLNDEARWPRSGSAQPFIKPSDVKAHSVWVPDRAKQAGIVATLDGLSNLQAKLIQRRKLIATLRSRVLQDAFRGRGADQVPTRLLGALCTPKQWRTISKANMVDSGHPVYGANGVIGYSAEFNHRDPVLLVGCRGTIGAIHLTQPNSYVTGNAMALDGVDEQAVLIRYLAAFLTWRGFADVTTGSSQPQLTRQSIVGIEIPIADFAVQQRVAMAFEKLDEVQELNERAIAVSAALMIETRRRAFEGER